MHFIGRRNFLAGLGLGAGAHLLGSMFKTMIPEALGQSITRKRMILFTAANGLLERFYNCPARNENDWDLSPVLSPLAAHKKRMVVASKFYNPFSKALHGNQHATLTMKESTKPGEAQERGPPGGISIDRFIGKQIGAGDAFASTASGRGICVSADGPGQSFPLIGSPSKAFDTYFGGAGGGTGPMGPATGGGGFEKDFLAHKSFLDVLRPDIARMNARLAGPEKAKLDQYLESLRNLEREVAQRANAQGSCMKGTRPADPPVLGDAIAAHIDIIFAAQRCGLTRVSHIAFEGMEGPHIVYNWLGDPRNHHDDHHAGDTAILQKIATWWFQKVNQMVTLLANTPEGNGTMLDNSLVAYVNTCGGTHHRGYDTHPVIMIGGAGGALRTGTNGRYLTYPEKRHSLADAYVSWAQMMDVKIDKFGDPAHSKGPVPGLV